MKSISEIFDNIKTNVYTKDVEISPAEIIQIRRKLGLSQENFAKLLGISSRTVYFWEHGVTKPSPLALEKLQKVAKKVKQQQGA